MDLVENSSLETPAVDSDSSEQVADNLGQELEAQLSSSLDSNEGDVSDQATGEEEPDTPAGAEENATQEDVLDWTKDGRFKEHWSEDPNNLYKSYKSLEGKLQEDGEHRNQLTSELDQVKGTLKQYDEVVQYLDLIGQNPEYNKQFQGVLQEINKDMRRKQYGTDLPDHVIAKLDEVDSVKRELAQMQEERVVREHTTIIDDGMKNIDKLAKDHGIEYSVEDFLKHCLDNDVPPSLMNSVFIAQNMDTILAKQKSQTQEKVLKNVNSNSSGSMPVGTRPAASPSADNGTFNGFRTALKNTLGIKN